METYQAMQCYKSKPLSENTCSSKREVLFSTAFDDYVAIYLSEFRKLVKENPERARQIALKQLQDAGIVDAQGNVRSL